MAGDVHILRDIAFSTKALSGKRSRHVTCWSRELKSEREDLSESTLERRDQRLLTARMKSWQ